MDLNITVVIATILISGAIFIPVGILIRKKIAESKIQGAEEEAKKILELANKEAENKKKEEIFKAKEEIMNARNELDQEIKERRGEIQNQEKRMFQKEENLDKRSESLEKREKDIELRKQEVEKEKGELEQIIERQTQELERISGLSSEDAKKQLLSELDKKITTEKAFLIKELEQKFKEKSEKNAKEIISYAIQKCAADHSQETTVSIVSLPNDDMKGRIIGREGRNIKALETLTGVDLIIDDTPEAVILSGFDPLRREVAKIALEKLIDDGRIHPAKIEEMVEKAKEELSATIREEGERAILETGVIGLHPDLVKLIGKLKYRTSYGQNVLNHSIEVSNLARIMAEELGLDPKIARRAGLLHDIGKALDHDMEGTHVEIGVDILKKYKENELVINAVEAHHGDVEPLTLEAVLVQAADAISASRPGARRETLEAYIKRLQNLEEIADAFDGVEKSFAIQAGREVRIMVKPEKISDSEMTILARQVSERIENEMDYPGQIKVNIIRETRIVDYAK
ncbi:MAG TPA: ribonuclease Y [Candidatus Merdicola faecigallinarum]|uniref:Ribonuclease Y n=1 Tax=Candidatus Merdicola faecigallinarum TaxID=2840862 RepID=A0A9D1S9G8_9FIRM|nr:ribonuclease Y [Candidatus Merdicola faecigallinarum]